MMLRHLLPYNDVGLNIFFLVICVYSVIFSILFLKRVLIVMIVFHFTQILMQYFLFSSNRPVETSRQKLTKAPVSFFM